MPKFRRLLRPHRGRVAFATMSGASRVASDMTRRNGVPYEAYVCRVCSMFHVGKV